MFFEYENEKKPKKINISVKNLKNKLSHDNTINVKNDNNKLHYSKFCVICQFEFETLRSDTLTCSEVCRRKLRYCLQNNKPLPFDVNQHKQKLIKSTNNNHTK